MCVWSGPLSRVQIERLDFTISVRHRERRVWTVRHSRFALAVPGPEEIRAAVFDRVEGLHGCGGQGHVNLAATLLGVEEQLVAFEMRLLQPHHVTDAHPGISERQDERLHT